MEPNDTPAPRARNATLRVIHWLAFGLAFSTCSYAARSDILDCFTDSPVPEHCRGAPFGLALVPQPPAMPADLLLADADASRVRAVLDAELGEFYRHPELRRRIAATTRGAASHADASAAARAMGQEIVHAGLRRLALPELEEWNRLRGLLAQSDSVCAGFWTGQMDAGLLAGALARLSDADLHAWMRISARAGILELEARSPVPDDPEGLGEGLDAILAALPESERALVDGALDAPEAVDAPTACRALRTLLQGAASLDTPLRERYLRGLAAL